MYGTVSASFVLEGYGALYAMRASRAQARKRLALLEQAMAQVAQIVK